MRIAHATATVRAAEAALMARLPDGALMRRAAFGLASACAGALPGVYGARVAVLAGTGDNGGDAMFAGAALARRGAAVTAVLTGPKWHQAAAEALTAAGGRLAAAAGPDAAAAIERASLIIDGILGIGGRGGLREPAAGLAEIAARSARAGAVVVAADLPSGVDSDTGAIAGPAIRADLTVTFGTLKPGLLIDPGASHAGTVELVDIGLARYLEGPPSAAALQSADVTAMLPRPGADTDKYRRGVLGVVAGSAQYTGAAALAVGGAIRGGAGMVRLVSARAAADVVRQRWPEAVITVTDPGEPAAAVGSAGRVQAWVAGPGVGTGDDGTALIGAVLGTDVPVLVDADGLSIVARDRGLLARQAPTLITPHAGELARLLGADRSDVEDRRLEHARRAADELGVTVLLKGSTTVIAAAPGDPVLVNPTGTGWLATAGSGDVLSGLAGALIAQGLPADRAAGAAAYLHGLAGRLAASGAPAGASDVLGALPEAFRVVAEP